MNHRNRNNTSLRKAKGGAVMFSFLLLAGVTGCAGRAAGASQAVTAGTDAEENVSSAETDKGGNVLTVTFMNVGKADAITLQNSSSFVMIDTGTADTADQVVSELKRMGCTSIDALYITHFDQDHVGGAAEVIRNFEVQNIFVTYQSKDSDEIDAFYQAMADKGYTAQEILAEDASERAGVQMQYGGVEYSVYPPDLDEYDDDTSNNSSLVIRAQNGRNAFLFTGDIEKERIEELLDDGRNLRCDVIKIPHHGRKCSRTDDLIVAAQPAAAVITSSDEEPESEKTLEVLRENNVETYLTRLGEVKAVSDGWSVKMSGHTDAAEASDFLYSADTADTESAQELAQ